MINDSNITVNTIETSINQQHLVCTTDRMPCCQASPQYGEWYFPNGSQIKHKQEGAVAFHRSRDNDGNVHLFRTHHTIRSPTGRFCCEVEDATGTNQTLCVNIIFNSASVCVLITDDGGIPTLGQSYSLTCSVAGDMDDVTTFQWSKDDRKLNETGPTLSFQHLRISDSGVYTCAITVDSMLYNSTMKVNVQGK